MSVIKEMVEAINAKAAEMTTKRNSLIDEGNGTIAAKLDANLAILDDMKADFTKAEAARAEAYATSLKSTEAEMKETCDSFIADGNDEAWDDIAGAYAEIVKVDADEDAGILAFGEEEKKNLSDLADSIGNADEVDEVFNGEEEGGM
tara:strand:+ start:62 stop:502 length:441 start_codon:yes stop_codon:yes gene_type:complete